jgi:hypothetical protein
LKGSKLLSFGYAAVTKQMRWGIKEEEKSERFAVMVGIKAEKNSTYTCAFDRKE